MSSVYLGYALSNGGRLVRQARLLPDSWDPQRAVRFGVWLLVACAFLTALFALSVGPSVLLHFYLGRNTKDFQTILHVVGYVGLGPYLSIPATIIFAFGFLRLRSLQTAALLALSLSIALFITFPRGDRTYILALVLPLLVLPYVRAQRRPGLMATLGAIVLAALAITSSSISATSTSGRPS